MIDSKSTSTSPKVSLWPLCLLLASLPLGIAAQGLVGAVTLIALVAKPFGQSGHFTPIGRDHKLAAGLAIATILAQIIAAMANPVNTTNEHFSFFLGYATWCLLPLIAFRSYGQLTAVHIKALYKWLLVITLLWAVIAATQAIWGWRIHGIEFTSDFKRPRGLYSHPLTFAYTAFLLWPLSVYLAFKRPQMIYSWLLFASVGLIIALTNSRTIQLAALLCLVVNGLRHLSGKMKVVGAAVLTAALILIATTDNPMSDKFSKTFSEAGVDRSTHYQDDRLAFWAAHALMIKEKPLLGHGYDLGTKYRTPYYEELGLGDFANKYEAHNSFIQLLANGGVVALILFLAWYGWQFRLAWKVTAPGAKEVLVQTFIFWGLTALTQNSFQDGEARLALTFVSLTALLWPKEQGNS